MVFAHTAGKVDIRFRHLFYYYTECFGLQLLLCDFVFPFSQFLHDTIVLPFCPSRLHLS